MANKPIQTKDIVEQNVLKKTIAEFEAWSKVVNKVEKDLLDLAKVTKQGLLKVDTGDIKALKSLNKSIEDISKSTEMLTEAKALDIKLDKAVDKEVKKSIKTKKEIIELTDDEIKENIRLRKAKAQRRKDLEAEIILENKSIKNKEELQARLKALRIEGSKLDLGSDELKANIEEIDALTDRLKDNSDQFIKNKINIGNYKDATIDLTDSFDDQQKRLKILTDTYKNAVLQGKKNTKQAKELKKALDDQKEALEDVKEATDDASKATKKLGDAGKAVGVGLILVAIAKISEFFGSSREASLESSKAFAIFSESVKVFFQSVVNAWDGAKVIFNSAVTSIQQGVVSIQLSYQEAILLINKALDANPLADYSEEISVIEDNIKTLNNEQNELAKSTETVADGWNMITDAFKGNIATTNEAIESHQKFLQLQLDTEISIEKQTRALAGLQEQRQIDQDISDDDTLGFLTRAKAVEKAQASAIKFAKLEEDLARTKEKLTIEAIKQDLLTSKALSKSELDRIRSGEQLNSLLKQRGIALKVSSENESAFTEAFTERVDKQVEALSFARDQEEKNRKTERDSYEQRLDIIEEFSEIQFARNEELLNSDKSTQEERLRLFKDNEAIRNNLLNDGVELTIKQAKDSIDLNERLSDSEKQIAKDKLDLFDVNELIEEQNQQIVFDKIRALDLGEIEEKRLKDTIKITKEQTKALKVQQEVLNETDRDALELKKDIEAQKKALITIEGESIEERNAKISELEDTRAEDEKQNLRDRIAVLKKDSIARLELEQELNELLLQEKADALAKEEEADAKKKKSEEDANKKRKQRVKDFQESLLNILEEALDARSKRIQAELDKELDASKTQQERLQDLADKGSRDALEGAQKERERQQEIEKEKLRQERIQANLKKGIEVFKVLASNDGDVGKTIADVTILEAFIKGLSSFDVGTESLGVDGKGVDGKGGIPIIAHKGEGILTEKTNSKKLKAGLTNETAIDYAIKYQNLTPQLKEKEVVKEFNEWLAVKKSIDDLPSKMPVQSLFFDEQEKAYVNIIKRNGKTERKHSRSNGLFR